MSVHERSVASHRRVQSDEVRTGEQSNAPRPGGPSTRPLLVGLFACVLLFVVLAQQLSLSERQSASEADKKQSSSRLSYGIVFDAGSTGSRIHVYRFEPLKDGSLHLKDELFEEVKPGLSSFAAKPRDAGLSIEPLLEKAKQFIPKEDWDSVPLALYATAGLRLVSDNVAQQILDEVRSSFARSPFRVCDDCVRILDGLEEGTFAWYAINYMLGYIKLGDAPSQETVGVIDLGGGSVQITFLADSVDEGTPAHFLHETSEFGEPLTIYSHSYLGLGLNAARFELLAMTTSDADLHLPKSANGAPRKWTDIDPDSSVTYTSPCFAHTFQGTWRYHGVDVHVRGIPPTEGENAVVTHNRFDMCYATAKRLVTIESNVHHPPAVHRLKFYIQSYFLDRAVDSGLITEAEGGTVTVTDYERVARQVCSETQADSKRPFLCMDLSFMTALLRDGFGFDENSTLVLKKQLQNFELSWTIGAVFPLFQ